MTRSLVPGRLVIMLSAGMLHGCERLKKSGEKGMK